MDVSLSKKSDALPLAFDMLKGRAAVVTGSTSGIGLGIAAALAAQSADMLLNRFGDPAEIDRVRGALAETHGVRVSYSAADMSKPDTAPVREFPMEHWSAILAINLTSAFCAIRAVLPQMESRRWTLEEVIAATEADLATSPEPSKPTIPKVRSGTVAKFTMGEAI